MNSGRPNWYQRLRNWIFQRGRTAQVRPNGYRVEEETNIQVRSNEYKKVGEINRFAPTAFTVVSVPTKEETVNLASTNSSATVVSPFMPTSVNSSSTTVVSSTISFKRSGDNTTRIPSLATTAPMILPGSIIEDVESQNLSLKPKKVANREIPALTTNKIKAALPNEIALDAPLAPIREAPPLPSTNSALNDSKLEANPMLPIANVGNEIPSSNLVISSETVVTTASSEVSTLPLTRNFEGGDTSTTVINEVNLLPGVLVKKVGHPPRQFTFEPAHIALSKQGELELARLKEIKNCYKEIKDYYDDIARYHNAINYHDEKISYYHNEMKRYGNEISYGAGTVRFLGEIKQFCTEIKQDCNQIKLFYSEVNALFNLYHQARIHKITTPKALDKAEDDLLKKMQTNLRLRSFLSGLIQYTKTTKIEANDPNVQAAYADLYYFHHQTQLLFLINEYSSLVLRGEASDSEENAIKRLLCDDRSMMKYFKELLDKYEHTGKNPKATQKLRELQVEMEHFINRQSTSTSTGPR